MTSSGYNFYSFFSIWDNFVKLLKTTDLLNLLLCHWAGCILSRSLPYRAAKLACSFIPEDLFICSMRLSFHNGIYFIVRLDEIYLLRNPFLSETQDLLAISLFLPSVLEFYFAEFTLNLPFYPQCR